MTAVSPSTMPQAASTGAPSGPRTTVFCQRPPLAVTTASTVPGPPSAMGTKVSSASGSARRKAVGYGLRRLDGGEAALELLRRDDDPHELPPWPL